MLLEMLSISVFGIFKYLPTSLIEFLLQEFGKSKLNQHSHIHIFQLNIQIFHHDGYPEYRYQYQVIHYDLHLKIFQIRGQTLMD